MKVLIIGGSRFVGPYLISMLIDEGHEVTVFNRGNKLLEYDKNVRFIRGDRNLNLNIKEHFDTVIDNCAYTGLQTQKATEELDYDFFLHFGTAAAYKKGEIFPLLEESSIGKWPLWSDYNKGKVECEEVLKEKKIKCAIIRPVYILGPRNLVADRENFIYARIKNNVPIIVPGNGEAIIQFAYVKDVAKSIVLLATKQIEGPFNCAGNESITLNGLVDEMGNIVGKEPVIKHNYNADGANWKESEFPFANENFVCKNDKLRKLGINFIPLLQGLKEDYENYYKNNLKLLGMT